MTVDRRIGTTGAASVGRVAPGIPTEEITAQSVMRGVIQGAITADKLVTSSVLSEEGVDRGHAKALEILGPGTVTRAQVRAILAAALPSHKI